MLRKQDHSVREQASFSTHNKKIYHVNSSYPRKNYRNSQTIFSDAFRE